MKNALATLALAAVPALILSACNGNSASGGSGVAPAVPNAPAASSHRSHVRRSDNGPQDLHAGGSTFAAYAYNLGNQPTGAYNSPQAPPGQGSLFYAAADSRHDLLLPHRQRLRPRRVRIEQRYDDDGVRAARRYSNGTRRSSGPARFRRQRSSNLVHRVLRFGDDLQQRPPHGFRYVGSTVRVPGLWWTDRLRLPASRLQSQRQQDPAVHVDVLRDRQRNDQQLERRRDHRDNGTSVTGGPSEPITFYFRSDKSGTTFLYTTALNAQCNVTFKKPYNKPPYGGPSRNAAWPYGVNQTWPGPGSASFPNPNFIGESGNPGVLAGIQSTPFGTGYVEGAWAASANPHVGQALLQNGMKGKKAIFVDPTNKTAVANALKKLTASNITYGGGSDGNPLGSTTPWCQLYIDPSNYDLPPKKSYPIVGPTYLMFYGQNNGVHVSDKIALIKYLMSSAANKIVGKLEYAPLSSSLQTATLNALNGSGSQSACLQ